MEIEVKMLFAIAAAVIGLASFWPYLRDILAGTTKPHIYTWLIWVITQGIATAAAWSDGGWGAYNLLLATIFNTGIVLLAMRYGTKDITKHDTVLLCGALAALVIWWQLEDALLAVLVATVIDIFGYIPTYRKTWKDPSTETPSAWFGFFLAMLFSLLALESYTPLTATYLVAITISNGLLFLITVRKPYGQR